VVLSKAVYGESDATIDGLGAGNSPLERIALAAIRREGARRARSALRAELAALALELADDADLVEREEVA